MHLTWKQRELHPRHVFRISRGEKPAVTNVFVRLLRDDVEGLGEASTNVYYGETWEIVAARLEAARNWLAGLNVQNAADIEAAWEEAWTFCTPSRAAQCAIDLALWDWLAKRNETSVAELVWGEHARPVTSFCTIGLSTSDELAAKLRELGGFPRIKVKSDSGAGEEIVRALRSHNAPLIAVDANCAWSRSDISDLLRRFRGLDVTFVEQPLLPDADTELPTDRALPIFADESCVVESDVDRMPGIFDGFNIKLVKCGGITPARRMIARGRELGLQMMVGCMLESSVLIAAGAAIAQKADYADLDGAWLLADDPYSGWTFERGILHPPDRDGLGITERG